MQLCLPKLLYPFGHASRYRPGLYLRLDVAIAYPQPLFDVVSGLPSDFSIVLVKAPDDRMIFRRPNAGGESNRKDFVAASGLQNARSLFRHERGDAND